VSADGRVDAEFARPAAYSCEQSWVRFVPTVLYAVAMRRDRPPSEHLVLGPARVVWLKQRNGHRGRQVHLHCPVAGSVCTKDCHPVIAGCETEVIKAGDCTVKYGRRTLGLRVPSVMSDPCLRRD
jgi:hypothetical protein